jgi:Kef-type K+ transport system membrane component KefB
MVTFFLEIAVMLSMALLCGQLMSRLRLPAVFGELFGGIILGPTVWGQLSPHTFSWLFPASGPVFQGRDALIQICMLFFLFAAGLEMNLSLARKQINYIAWASLAGIVVPFIMGFSMVAFLPDLLTGPYNLDIKFFAILLGTALSI